MKSCPLCTCATAHLLTDHSRAFFHCPHCELIFADPASQLDRQAERAIYDQHENDPNDERYRRFLNRLATPLLAKLQPGMCGLDYGCGPGPTLSLIFEEAGMRMSNYDPIYAPDTSVLAQHYDFVSCTEVVEHFYNPLLDWTRLSSLITPGGWLGVMTSFAPPLDEFSDWHYKNDPTHVSFYSTRTFAWLAQRLGLHIEAMSDNVVLLRKIIL